MNIIFYVDGGVVGVEVGGKRYDADPKFYKEVSEVMSLQKADIARLSSLEITLRDMVNRKDDERREAVGKLKMIASLFQESRY